MHWVTWQVLYCGPFIEETCSPGDHSNLYSFLDIFGIDEYSEFWSIYFLVHYFNSPELFLRDLQLYIKEEIDFDHLSCPNNNKNESGVVIYVSTRI